MKLKTKSYLSCFAIITMLWAVPWASRAQVLYISNQGSSDTVGAFDATTGAAIAGFNFPGGVFLPEGVALSGNNLYVTNRGANQVRVYNATTGAATATFTTTTSSGLSAPLAIAVSGNTLYVVNYSTLYVTAYNATTGAAIPGFTRITGLDFPMGLTVSGNTLYIASSGSSSILAFNATTGATITSYVSPAVASFNYLGGLAGPWGLAISGNTLYVANTGGSSDGTFPTIDAYDLTTGASIAGYTPPTGLSMPTDVVVSGNALYVTDLGSNKVDEFNATTGAPITGFISPSGLQLPGFIAIAAPEPGSCALLAVGAGGLLILRRPSKAAPSA
jgi:DNA-binding beta-propeller fold protein YncE